MIAGGGTLAGRFSLWLLGSSRDPWPFLEPTPSSKPFMKTSSAQLLQVLGTSSPE
jgi:hypothetical protein